MLNAVFTTAAVLAMSAVVQGIGQAVVVNQCSDPVTLANVPAAGGGHSQVGPEPIAPGGRYSQIWTELTNGQGWSLKLYKGTDANDLIQYEYTFHNDGTIWYDLSAVNGDPWSGDWSISSSGGCDPRQAAYQYPTDDANGMQSCPDSSTIQVTLCSSGGSAPPPDTSDPGRGPVLRPSPAAPTDTAPPADPTDTAPPSVPTPPDNGRGDGRGFNNLAATTLATVTNVQTKVVTQTVIVSPSPVHQKRDEHLHHHMQHHNHF